MPMVVPRTPSAALSGNRLRITDPSDPAALDGLPGRGTPRRFPPKASSSAREHAYSHSSTNTMAGPLPIDGG